MSSPTSDVAASYRPGAGRGGSAFAGAIAAALFLTGCGGQDDDIIAGAEPIDCRPAGANMFDRVCTIERTASPEGGVLVARLPDGGFRRLLIVTDGRGVIAADGAEPVRVSAAGADHIDVAARDVVFRLPARIVA